jgi:antitoxin (DNA-binding transcriptional repressor) of toxin-antitoxin stability system
VQSISISVTEAARNFADCVNRVRYQGATFLLYKSGVPVAELVPVDHKIKEESELQKADGYPKPDMEPSAEKHSDINQPRAVPTPDIW